MIYFISGHRDLSYEDFEKYYVPKIQEIFDADRYPGFVIGDCYGADKFAMDYIVNNYYDTPCEMTIYHMFEHPRVTPADRDIDYYSRDVDELFDEGIFISVNFVGGFESDEERDATMTRDSDFDIAFIKDDRWDSGTAQNIKRRHGL